MGMTAAGLQHVLLEPGLSALPGRGEVQLIRLGGGFNHASTRSPPLRVVPPEELNGLEQEQKLWLWVTSLLMARTGCTWEQRPGQQHAPLLLQRRASVVAEEAGDGLNQDVLAGLGQSG